MPINSGVILRPSWKCLCLASVLFLLAFAGCGSSGNGPGRGQDPTGSIVLAAGGAQISGFRQDTTTGALTISTGSPFSAGAFAAKACAANASPRMLFIAQANNSVTSYLVNGTTGAPTAANSVATAGIPAAVAVLGNFLYVTNSSTDNISGFSFNATTGVLTALTGFPFATDAAPGAIIAHPNGNFLYAAGQQASTIRALSVDTAGALANVENGTVTLGGAATGMAFTPDGAFLLVVDTAQEIRSYSVGTSGLLTQVTGSPLATPVGFSAIAVTPNGKFAYAVSQSDSNVYAFTITNGVLAGGGAVAAGTVPSSVTVDPTGSFLLVANTGSSNLSVFSINATSGALTQVSGSPVSTVLGPVCVAVLP